MNCEESQIVLQGYADGELDLVRSLEVERHLESCPGCSKAYEDVLALGVGLKSAALYRVAPPGLDRRIRGALEERAPARTRGRMLSWAAMAASAAAIALVTWQLAPRSAEGRVSDEVVSSHIRSLMANHLTDVGSSDQHTVKPWFAGKLDFAPVVKDLAAQGFPLVGGRLDYIGGRPAAALVYQRRKHTINVFNRPSAGSSAVKVESTKGYNVVHWTANAMEWWVVSDLSRNELETFARLLQEA